MFYVFVVIIIGALFLSAMFIDLRNRRHNERQQHLRVKRGDADNYLVGDNKYLNSGS